MLTSSAFLKIAAFIPFYVFCLTHFRFISVFISVYYNFMLLFFVSFLISKIEAFLLIVSKAETQ